MRTSADFFHRFVNARHAAVVAAVWAITVAPASGADAAGMILLAKGSAEAQATDGTVRVLRKGAEVFAGDTLRTAAKSFVVVRFTDGGKVTVRPGTVMVIDDYAYGGDSDGSTLRLVKGGLRALTGAIAKTNPDAYRVDTPVATLGVRGTEFDVRWCEGDCVAGESRPAG